MSQLFTSHGQNIGASASNEYSGLVSFRIDWFDLLAIQGKAVTPAQQANRLQRTDLCLLHVDQTLAETDL